MKLSLPDNFTLSQMRHTSDDLTFSSFITVAHDVAYIMTYMYPDGCHDRFIWDTDLDFGDLCFHSAN